MEEQADKQIICRHGKFYSVAIDKMLWKLEEQVGNCAWGSGRAF